MKIRMYNVGFGDCFCLRDRGKNLLVDFGSSNSRIGGRTRKEVFDVIISDMAGIVRKNLLLTHFHLDHLSGLLYMLKHRSGSGEFGKIYLPDVFSGPEMSRTLAVILLADLVKDFYLPSRQVSLFALVEVLYRKPQKIELLSRGCVFEGKYQALWPDRNVICEETEEVLRELEIKYPEAVKRLLALAEQLRQIVWRMTSEGSVQEEEASLPGIGEIDRGFRELRSLAEFEQLLDSLEKKRLALRRFKSKISIVFQNAADGEWNLLFTGDAEPQHMKLIAENYDGNIPLYEHYWCIKVPHHGTESHYFDFKSYTPENLLISNGVYYANSRKKEMAYRTSMQYTGLFQLGEWETYMCCSNCDCCDGYRSGCSCREMHVIAPNYYFDI